MNTDTIEQIYQRWRGYERTAARAFPDFAWSDGIRQALERSVPEPSAWWLDELPESEIEDFGPARLLAVAGDYLYMVDLITGEPGESAPFFQTSRYPLEEITVTTVDDPESERSTWQFSGDELRPFVVAVRRADDPRLAFCRVVARW